MLADTKTNISVFSNQMLDDLFCQKVRELSLDPNQSAVFAAFEIRTLAKELGVNDLSLDDIYSKLVRRIGPF